MKFLKNETSKFVRNFNCDELNIPPKFKQSILLFCFDSSTTLINIHVIYFQKLYIQENPYTFAYFLIGVHSKIMLLYEL